MTTIQPTNAIKTIWMKIHCPIECCCWLFIDFVHVLQNNFKHAIRYLICILCYLCYLCLLSLKIIHINNNIFKFFFFALCLTHFFRTFNQIKFLSSWFFFHSLHFFLILSIFFWLFLCVSLPLSFFPCLSSNKFWLNS